MSVDVFTFGEAMLRFSVPAGDRLEDASAFDVHVAGSEANVASALGFLGRRVVWASMVPEGPLGGRVINTLGAAGVDCSGVRIVRGGRLGTYFVQLNAPPRPVSIVYDRAGSTAASMTPDDIPWELVDEARIVHLSGITPALSSSCRETVEAVADRVRESDALLSIDINYRAKLWSASEAGTYLEQLCQSADLVVCSAEDGRDLFAAVGEPAKIALALAERFTARRIIVTNGPEGAWWWEDGETGHAAAIPVSIIDRVGAGDAFVAGVIDGLLDDDVAVGVRRGTALAAIALTSRGDQPRLTRNEMEALLGQKARRVDR